MLRFLLLLFSILFSFRSIEARNYVAATLNYPPYQYYENGREKGLSVDFINVVFDQLNLFGVSYQFYPWKRAVYITREGQVDFLFNAGENDERKEWGVYVKSTLINQIYVFFARSDSSFSIDEKYSNVHDLIIGIRSGYLYGKGEFRKSLDEKKYKDIEEVDSTKQNVEKLLRGRIDLFVGDYLPVMFYLRENCLLEKTRILKNIKGEVVNVLNWPTYLLISKRSDLIDYVDEIENTMNNLKKNGTYSKILKKYESSSNQPCD